MCLVFWSIFPLNSLKIPYCPWIKGCFLDFDRLFCYTTSAIFKNLRRCNLPVTKSATKEARKTKKKHLRMVSFKTRLKTLNKKILSSKKADEAKKLLDTFLPEIQRCALKNVLHKNKASRMISKLQKHVNSLSKKQ